MIPYKVNGTPEQMPSMWSEMSFEKYLQFLRLKEGSDFNDVVSICSGKSLEELKSSRIEGLESVLQTLQFTQVAPVPDDKPLKVGKYNIPEDITFEYLGQFSDLMKIMESVKGKEIGDIVEAYAKYCAIYIQGTLGPYDGEKALALLPEIMQAPCTEVISAGSFFFVKLISLSKGITSNSRKGKSTLKKRLLDFLTYTKYLALGLRLKIWPKNWA